MTSVLKISLSGNLVLFVVIAWLLTRPVAVSPSNNTVVAAETHTRFHDSQSPPYRDALGGFSWRQIESTDYPTYMTNLRQIGCPEQTIADIIRADVHSLYTKKRADLGLVESGSGAWSSVEEGQVIARLLGSTTQPEDRTEGSDGTAVTPLVFRDPDPTFLHLDPEQEAAVNELRAEFSNEIGGANQDPAEPAYAQRWRHAQPESDRLLRGMIGVNAFMELQNQGQ